MKLFDRATTRKMLKSNHGSLVLGTVILLSFIPCHLYMLICFSLELGIFQIEAVNGPLY